MSGQLMALTSLVVFFGAMIQRITGMGLALVASPLLVLVLGADLGVQTVQIVGVLICGLSAWSLRRDVSWRRAGMLFATSIVGVVPGTLLTRRLPSAWLLVVIGSLTVVALLASRFTARSRIFDGQSGEAFAGGLSGFMNVTAGVGGPPIVIFANSTNWAYAEYVATVQAFFMGLNVISLLGRGVPHLHQAEWLAIGASSVAGLMVGHRVSGSIDERIVKPVIFTVALLGAIAATIRGLLAL